MSTVSQVRVLSMGMSALAVLIVGLAGAAPARAGFVPALGSPFQYAAPTSALAVGDADRNGTVDVVAGGLTLRRGAGTGFLGNPITVGATGAVDAVAAGDLNGDGLLDYAAIAGAPRQLLRFIAVPGGGYVQEALAVDADDAAAVAIANVNGDGLSDIVFVRDEGDPNVTVLYGGLPGSDDFTSGIGSPRSVAIGDLTGDGRPELVVAGEQTSVSVLRNVGGGNFSAGALKPTGAAGVARHVALAQLNGDGRLDLLATDNNAAALLALLGDGNGSFTPLGARPTGLPGSAVSVAAGDVNGDGATDALAGGDDGFAVLLGDGGGAFSAIAGSPFSAGGPADDLVEDVVAVDMNRDGQLDVVTANRSGSVSVMLNDQTGLLASSPTGVNFGTMLPATGTRTRTVTLRANRGRLHITRLDRQGSPTFSIKDGNCVGRTLLLGQSCTLSVSFNAPRKARRYEALLSVDANAAAVVVPLTATPRAPIVRRARLKSKRVAPGKRLDLRYALSEGALTRVITEQALPGRRVGSRCVAPRRGNLKRRSCTLWLPIATVTRRDLGGPNRMRVLTRAKPRGFGRKRRPGAIYPVGTYRLSVSALDRFRNRSDERRVQFKVLRLRG